MNLINSARAQARGTVILVFSDIELSAICSMRLTETATPGSFAMQTLSPLLRSPSEYNQPRRGARRLYLLKISTLLEHDC